MFYQSRIVDIEYFHLPIFQSGIDSSIGSGIVLGISNFRRTTEGTFIITLAKALGMAFQDNDDYGAKKLTHLVTLWPTYFVEYKKAWMEHFSRR